METKEGEWNIKTLIWETLKTILLALIIIIPIRIFLFQPFFVEGTSMEPNFQDNNYLIIQEFFYKHVAWVPFLPQKDFVRGDVAVFHPPNAEESYYIKRVIGLPGETVEIKNNQTIIYNQEHPDGMTLDEPYIAKDSFMADMARMEIGEDEYFVMGDNRRFSFDSRKIGPVAKTKVVGKVLIRVLPLNELQVY